MTHTPDVRLKQAARILGVSHESLDIASARDAFHSRPGDVASALFQEAAENDDVVSVQTALDYLEDRLDYLAAFLDSETNDAVRTAFQQRIEAWEG
ncbi:MAG: hypothetical protein M0R74_02310 [Dehalococcoidia bacterium]|nr:hypothetical protein [Dehalococcoidia bacterium]